MSGKIDPLFANHPANIKREKQSRNFIETLKAEQIEKDRELCECPKCGRSHWRLGAPPWPS